MFVVLVNKQKCYIMLLKFSCGVKFFARRLLTSIVNAVAAADS